MNYGLSVFSHYTYNPYGILTRINTGNKILAPEEDGGEVLIMGTGLYFRSNKSNQRNPYNPSDREDDYNRLPSAPDMSHCDPGDVILGPISDDYVGTVGLAGTGFGGSAAWTAAEVWLENGKVWTKSLTAMKGIGNAVGGVGFVLTGANMYLKYQNNTLNTSDWVDFGASAILLGAGLALTAPVSIGIVVGVGTVYGIYRLAAGEKADIWINKNFGFRP
jgi:hypothetical protein